MSRTDTGKVRLALDATDSEYPDESLDWAIDVATDLVDRELDPHTTEDLTIVETFLAAAEAIDGSDDLLAATSSITSGSARLSLDTDRLADDEADYLEKAIRHDPTGRLANLGNGTASIKTADKWSS